MAKVAHRLILSCDVYMNYQSTNIALPLANASISLLFSA